MDTIRSRTDGVLLSFVSDFIFSFWLFVLKYVSSSVAPDRLEVVLLEIMGDLLAQHGSLCVIGAEMDASPYSRVDYFFEYV